VCVCVRECVSAYVLRECTKCCRPIFTHNVCARGLYIYMSKICIMYGENWVLYDLVAPSATNVVSCVSLCVHVSACVRARAYFCLCPLMCQCVSMCVCLCLFLCLCVCMLSMCVCVSASASASVSMSMSVSVYLYE